MYIPIFDNNLIKCDLSQFFKKNKNKLIKTNLVYGAILFRNFDLNPTIFEKTINNLNMKEINMFGSAAPRTKIQGTIYTANDSPPSEKIPMHHEMAQTKNPPSHIFFYCEQPSSIGGETPLIDSRKIYDYIYNNHNKIYKELKNGIYYERTLSEYDDVSSALGKGWKNCYDVKSKKEMEDKLNKLYSVYKWKNNDLWMQTPIMPVFNSIYNDQIEYTFFNSIIAAYNGWNDSRNIGKKSITLSDGSYLNENFMNDLNEFIEENKIQFKWEKNDLLMIDNRVMMHSRNTFERPRKILTTIRTLN
jgi:hypothetical protein